MPRRRIGQEILFEDGPRRTSLDDIADLVDWAQIEIRLDPIHSAPRGEASWPPLAMFKALLLAVWHDLSDVRLAEALDDRASFRRFCEVSRNEAVPERTAFVRFRRELRRFDLDTLLFEEITVHLKAQAMTVKTRTLVDATVVQSASERALPEDPGAVYADSAYRGKVFADAVKERGGTAHVVATSIWAKNDPASQAKAERLLAEHDSAIQKVRCRVEKIFGTWKRSYGLRRMRWRGLTNARLQTHLTAIAYHLKRTLNSLNPA